MRLLPQFNKDNHCCHVGNKKLFQNSSEKKGIYVDADKVSDGWTECI